MAARTTTLRSRLRGALVAGGLLLAGAGVGAGPASAAGEALPPPDTHFSFDGLFGTFDRASAQRGFQIYKEVCSNCHSMRQLFYRNLRELGLSDAEVRAIAATVQVNDGPNDEGQMFERPGRPSDRFRSPFTNEKAARAANNGALPPDLSVITKAREHGADYVHALLVGYADPPEDFHMMEGMNYNKYFAGRQIAMAPPLTADEGQVEFKDGTKDTLEQKAHDITTFLAWAAEPELESRKQMGVRIVLFLTILGGLTYAVKRKVWSDVH